MTKDLFDKYIWLVDTIYRAGKISFEEINERWLRSRLSGGADIPLHPSQQEMETTEDYSIFEYRVRTTFDFKQELLSRGAEVEVLSPASFRQEMKEAVGKMKALYDE